MIEFKRNTRVICTVILFSILLFCLTGCSQRNEILDGQLSQVIENLFDNKPDELYEMFYPEAIGSKEEFIEWYHKINDMFPHFSGIEPKLKSQTVRSTVSKDQMRKTTYQGIYGFNYENERYQFIITYLETETACGILNVNVEKVMKLNGTAVTILILITLLWIAFVGFTVVDIIKQKPRKHVLWLILSLLLTFSLTSHGVRFGIPIGSVIYWSVRKRLLKGSRKEV